MYTVYAWEDCNLIAFMASFDELKDARQFALAALNARYVIRVKIENVECEVIEVFLP